MAQLTIDKITEIAIRTVFAGNFPEKLKNTSFFPMTVNGIEIAHLPCPMLKLLPL
jgi:hypothetical protein